MTSFPTVDVVIPVKNGMPEIRDCIQSLLGQTLQVNKIIAIDSGSEDGTDVYLSEVSEVSLIRILPSEFNHGLTRNIGWQESEAEFVFYTVQDATLASENVLEELIRGFFDESVAGVCGQQIVCHHPRNNPVEWYRPVSRPEQRVHILYQEVSFDDYSPSLKKEMCSWDNVVAMYRRSALTDIPFREVSFGEDMFWASDALKLGRTIVYRPTAAVCHYHLEDREVTKRRTLSSMYFRFICFGFISPKPVITFSIIVRMIWLIVKSDGLSMANRIFWIRYNLMRKAALREAWYIFDKALQSGDEALNSLYSDWIQQPPIPLKKFKYLWNRW